MSRSRVTLGVALMVGALGLTTTAAQAQTYPGTSVPTSSTSSTSTIVTNPTTPTTPTFPNPPISTVISIPGLPCTLTVTSNTLLLPGATVTLTVSCSAIVGGQSYSGVGASTPFALPSTIASPGAVSFRVTLPSDFALNATHGVTIRNDATGVTTGSGTFCVDKNGRIGCASGTAPRTGGGLPKTGTNHVGDLVKAGGALVALGGVVLLATKRRKGASAA